MRLSILPFHRLIRNDGFNYSHPYLIANFQILPHPGDKLTAIIFWNSKTADIERYSVNTILNRRLLPIIDPRKARRKHTKLTGPGRANLYTVHLNFKTDHKEILCKKGAA